MKHVVIEIASQRTTVKESKEVTNMLDGPQSFTKNSTKGACNIDEAPDSVMRNSRDQCERVGHEGVQHEGVEEDI